MSPFWYMGIAYLFLRQARDGGAMELSEIFNGFTEDFGGNLLLGLMMNIFIFLWSLLLVIPGVIKAYGYAMAYYIKVDNPSFDWQRCLNASAELMEGHKMELFIQHLSFIGWYIVGAFCCGIGSLWVAAYQNGADAQFYNYLINQRSMNYNSNQR